MNILDRQSIPLVKMTSQRNVKVCCKRVLPLNKGSRTRCLRGSTTKKHFFLILTFIKLEIL